MKPGICLKQIWSDPSCGLVELKIHSCDGQSSFTNTVYVGQQSLKDLSAELDKFKTQVYGGALDMYFGKFGPEYANGAFHASLYFHVGNRGRINITIKAQSDFREVGKELVASEAKLHLISEPALLDTFISELKALSVETRNDANLEAVCE